LSTKDLCPRISISWLVFVLLLLRRLLIWTKILDYFFISFQEYVSSYVIEIELVFRLVCCCAIELEIISRCKMEG